METEKQIYGIVYKTTNLINNKIYIGQHTKNKNYYFGSGKTLNKDIELLGKENFKRETLAECYSKEELNEQEEHFIRFYNSTDPEIGYNKSFGQGMKGLIIEEEHSKKLSEAHLKFYQSEEGVELAKKHSKLMSGENNPKFNTITPEEVRNKISETKRGFFNSEDGVLFRKQMSERYSGENAVFYQKEHSEESKNKISKALKGRPKSEDHKNNLSKSQKSFQESEAGKEFRKNMSELKKGVVFREDTKLKISQKMNGVPKSDSEILNRRISLKLGSGCNNIVYCKGTEYEHTFISTEEAMEYFDMTKRELAKLIASNNNFTLLKVRDKINYAS